MSYREKWHSDCGNVTLYLGDCLEILPTLGKVDCVVTDPPYSIANDFGTTDSPSGKRVLSWDWDKATSVDYVLRRVEAAVDATHERGSIACWCGSDQLSHIQDALRQRAFTPKMMAWIKSCPPPAMPGNWWPSAFEIGIYAYRQGAYFGDADAKRCNAWTHDAYRHGQPGKVGHPTQKSLPLIERLVNAMCRPSGVVLDGFMGSGTTGVACVRLGRKFIGIEIEPRYYEIAKRRIRDELAKSRILDPPAKKPTQKRLVD